MKFNKYLTGIAVSTALAGAAASAAMTPQLPMSSAELTNVNAALLNNTSGAVQQNKQSTGIFIVQLKGKSGVEHQLEPLTNNEATVLLREAGNNYNPRTPQMQAYIDRMRAEQAAVTSDIGNITVLHNYVHTFNGFAAKLNPAQLAAVKANPNVANVWEDELLEMTTANTPAFLGLTGPNGPHNNGVLGEGVVVGIVDSGIWPENPSFADDGTFNPAPDGWAGECNVGTIGAAGDAAFAKDETVTCNNKLIGARYFGAGFAATYDIQFDLGEFNSARDADGHGSHTAGTAAGNIVANAQLQGIDIGSLSGIAPRAHVAAYKVCWNADYVNPAGQNERGCFGADSQAAIDAAVADGVDVINYSISGSLTSVVAPQTLAMLRAAQAGVFVSVSAGNSGAGPGVVGTPAPWVMSVGASTYDGERKVVADEFEITAGDAPADSVGAIASGFSPSWPVGFGGAVNPTTENIIGCTSTGGVAPITPVEGQVNIALISRGTCGFVEKTQNAQDAGYDGVIVFNNGPGGPIVMGGTSATPILIPAVMVGQDEGNAIAAQASELLTTAVYTGDVTTFDVTEVGNVMAAFSSRGQNEAVADIIKPDITAPGVNVLAATSAQQLDFPGNNPLQGEDFAYLSGTSMSSPHIAGMAALLTEQFPTWTTAQKKSALMTTAYQGVTNVNGSAANPFDFGAGHADVIAAANPGFAYDANIFDYAAYLCGRDRDAVVAAETGFSCGAFAGAGYDFDASQLNYPSIAIGELIGGELIVRVVSDLTGSERTYDVSFDAPAGVTAELITVVDGVAGPATTLTVPAGGTAVYGIDFTVADDAVFDEWVFGSVTFTSGNIVNRSPIAVRPAPEPVITVPARVSLQVDRRGNASFPVEFSYTGTTSMEAGGLASPFGSSRTAFQDEDRSFTFNEPGLGFHTFTVPDGASLVRFSLFDDLVSTDNSDLDMFVYRCVAFSCAALGDAQLAGSNETVEILNPEPADGGPGNFYLVFVLAWDAGTIDGVAAESADYTMVNWTVSGRERNTRISSSVRAIDGKFNDVRITARNLEFFQYLGTAEFFDGDGVSQGTTVIEVAPASEEVAPTATRTRR